MSGYLKNNLKFFSVIFSAAFLVYAKSSAAWTSAHLFNVNVTVDLAESGPSTVTTVSAPSTQPCPVCTAAAPA